MTIPEAALFMIERNETSALKIVECYITISEETTEFWVAVYELHNKNKKKD